MSVLLENVPTPDGVSQRQWADSVVAYLREIERNLNTPRVLQLEHKRDNSKATVNGLLMFDNTTGSVVVSYNGAWKPLASMQSLEWVYNTLLDVLVVAVKGAVGMAAPTAFPAIGGGWQTINLFDEERLTSAGVTFNLPANTFGFQQECEVLLGVGASFTHNELNAGRTTYVRLWNVTDGVEAGRLVVGIGRNVAATNFSSVLAAKVQAANVNDSYRLEIGGGDAVSAITFQSFAMQITSAGAWLGPRPEIPTT